MRAVTFGFLRHSLVLTSLVGWLLVGAIPGNVAGQTESAAKYVDHVYHDDDGDHRYVVYVPAGYRADRPVPGLMFLHGAGERGTDNRLQLDVGLSPYIQARRGDFPFLAIFPQCEDLHSRLLGGWSADSPDGARALKILDQVLADYRVTGDKVGLVGWSMGGYGAWNLAAAAPEKFSAVLALSGGGNPENVEPLKSVPVWAVHGELDRLIPPAESARMVDALNQAGGQATLTTLPGAGHDLFSSVFETNAAFDWLREPTKEPSLKTAANAPRYVPAPVPFVPAVEIPNAIAVRLGNKSLKSLSYGMVDIVPANALVGRLNDMFDSTTAAGRSFSVRFAGISYSARLARVEVQAFAPDRLSIQLGVVNANLMIAGTSISGARQSAQTGPINISVGYNGPVWLSMDVTPYIDTQERRVRLRLNGASFPIPPNNYAVSAPAGVSTQGFGMTQERVVSGLMGGLYGARGRVEGQVISIAPQILAQLEEQLRFPDSSPFLAGVWPLPVYAPRARLWPQEIRTDASGINLVMGLTAAAYDHRKPKEPRVARVEGATLNRLSDSGDLEVSLAPGILQPLTELVVDRDLARIDVLDAPNQSFAKLADRTFLEEVIPAVKSLPESTELRAEFAMREPMEAGSSAAGGPFAFRLPRSQLMVSTREAGQKKWTPFAEFTLSISQPVSPELLKPAFDRRQIKLAWAENPEVTVSGKLFGAAEGSDASLNTDRFKEEFVSAWKQWTSAAPAADSEVPDIVFGPTRLRLQGLEWNAPLVAARFATPGVRVTNLAEVPFTYETKGPYSGWGGPYTLKTGESHQFDIAYDLTYRRVTDGQVVLFTLANGSHSEFRTPKKGGPPQLFQAKP
ncbi:MAG: prolyl oligopeptidase family serine peptidase [Planctomycetaceae bacterium]|nr:prolyl oligopeptidase family serine peptidase [Planctomycetaceae bacterium]